MNRYDLHGSENHFNYSSKVPKIHFPIVPDLSLVDYNNTNNEKSDLLHLSRRVSSSKKKGDSILEHTIENSPHNNESNSYVVWRSKNAHLFNNSAEESFNLLNLENTTSSVHHNKSVKPLLNKIVEISERLERKDLNKRISSECSMQQTNEIMSVGCNKIQRSSNENDSNYKRIHELYERVFPSSKLPINEDSLVDRSKAILRHKFKDNNNQSSKIDDRMRDGCEKMTVMDRGGSSKGSLSDGSHQNVKPCSSCNSCGSEYSPPVHFRNDVNAKYNYINTSENVNEHHCRRYDNPSVQPSLRYQDHLNDNNLRKMSISGSSNFCVCPNCSQNVSNEKHKKASGCQKLSKISPDSSSSNEDDVEVRNHCCFEKYKKSKKKKVTVDDLYNIVKLQNEQINLLQKQINRLIEQNNNIKKLHESNEITNGDCNPIKKCCGQQQLCSCQINMERNDKIMTKGFAFSVVQGNSKLQQNYSTNMNKCSNVSIGVMTSFVEVMQKMKSAHCPLPQHSNGTSGVDFNVGNHSNNPKEVHNSKTSDVTPARLVNRELSYPAVAEESFTLNDVDLPTLPVLINETVPTPQCSVHLDIQDFGSTTTSSSGSSDNENDPSHLEIGLECKKRNGSEDGRVGWTLYENVVGQVNKILQKNDPNNEAVDPSPVVDDVRNATIQHLRRLGVSFIDNDENYSAKKVTFDQQTENNISSHCATIEGDFKSTHGRVQSVEENRFKHLNEEQILQAAIEIMNRKRESSNVKATTANNMNPSPSGGGNNDISFATMKYLERYRLLPFSGVVHNGRNITDQVTVKKHKSHKLIQPLGCNQIAMPLMNPLPRNGNETRPQNFLSNKILDITALKQQPKLL